MKHEVVWQVGRKSQILKVAKGGVVMGGNDDTVCKKAFESVPSFS